MKIKLLRDTKIVSIISLVVFVSCCIAAPEAPATKPTADTAPANTEQFIIEAAELRNKAINESLEGEFTTAITKLKKAVKYNPDDEIARQALSLLEGYDRKLKTISKNRMDEYKHETQRIEWTCTAEKYADSLKKKPYAKKLRKLINKDLLDAFHDIGTSNGFEESSSDEAAEMQKTSLASISKASNIIDQATKLLEKDKSQFADIFRQNAKKVSDQLIKESNIWSQADPKTKITRWTTARKLFDIEYALADAITDLDILISKKPWRLALLYGQITKDMAPAKEKIQDEKWFKDLVALAQTKGKEAIKKAKWYDAMTAYSSLKELLPKDKNILKEYAKVKRHVRVLQLYGKKKDKKINGNGNGDDKDDDDDFEDESETWQNMVARVDARMVRKAITKLHKSYVKPIDYRKLTRGAIESILVLAKTPQVAKTFKGLKDEKKKKEFIDSLKRELADIDHPDRIDNVRLQMVLNRVLASNDESGVNIPVEVLVVEFADGFLSELDKFSSMIWPFDVENFNKSTMGHFTGIGVQITKKSGEPLKVVTPLLGTPAYKAGIKAGDIIMKVDGIVTKSETTDNLIKKIMGPSGTKVVLTIKRRGIAKPFDVPVIRQAVHIATIKGWQRFKDGNWDFILNKDKGIGYIRITQFTQQTHSSLRKALRDLREMGIDSLVLDLRGNPGGLLRSATKIADEFLRKGTIVSTQGQRSPRREIRANRKGEYENGDVVILIDQTSASAAEILSGALKDHTRGMVLGMRSYGKGSVQNIISVYSKSAYLKLTTAYYYLPSGRLLHRKPGSLDWGVNPDVTIFMTPKQTRDWIKLRRKTDMIQEVIPELMAADLKLQYEADVQLNTAVLMLELMQLKKQAQMDIAKLTQKMAA